MDKDDKTAGRARLGALIEATEAGLLERDTAVRLLLLAALAGEHVLLVGPPGSAKSELARRLQRALDGARWFERLLTRFSTPEELFGPLSLKALEDDRYERLVEGYLPTAGVAFLDEVFKANSAILNALLTLLNEREFDNGGGRLRTPLVSLVGASNEGPTDEALAAFHDRFLLRVPVQPVSDAAFAALLALDSAPPPPPAQPLTAAERQAWLARAATVALPAEVLQALQRSRAWLQAQQMPVSDRRWRQLLQLLKVQAASEGRAALALADLWLLPYALAPEADSVARVADFVAAELLGIEADEAVWLTRAVEGFERQAELEQRAEAEGAEDEAGKLALARAIAPRADDGGPSEMVRLLSRTVEEQRRRRYSAVHIAARVAQVDELLQGARQRLAEAQAAQARLAGQLANRLWLPPSQAAAWLGTLGGSVATLAALVARAEQARAVFAGLPLDPQAAPLAPAPISLP